MSVGRFTSAIVAGMLAGGLTVMSGFGREPAVDARPVAAGQVAPAKAAERVSAITPTITIVDPR